MTDFAYWLRTQADPDPPSVALRVFADARADWPWWTDQLRDYVGVIQAANPPNREDLISTVSFKYGRWQAERSQSAGFLSTLSSHMGLAFLVLFGMIVAGAIVYGLFINQKFFALMAKIDQARGLITFLFAFATIAIILLIAIATFWMPKDEFQARFDKAKDLLTILIGVLGTILGFYFGSLTVTQGIPPDDHPKSAVTIPAPNGAMAP